MKIRKISIKNYRSCINTTFEPNENLSAIIGPNGSGKTNVLSAIKLLPTLCLTRGKSFLSDAPITSPSACEIKTWYEIDGKSLVHKARLNLATNEKNQDEILHSLESWYMYDFTGKKNYIQLPSWLILDSSRNGWIGASSSGRRPPPAIANYLSSRGVDAKGFSTLQDAVEQIASISYYSASQFTNPANCPISFEVEKDNKRRTGISITGHKRFLYDIYLEKLAKSETYAEFNDLIGPSGIGLIEEIKFDEIVTSSSNYRVMTGGKVTMSEKNNLLVVPSFLVSGNKLSPSQLSEGTFKTLALIFYLVTDNSPILMVEEPEVCIHHGLLRSIIELIKVYSKKKQMIISTHSDAVLDKLSFENVFTVKRELETGSVVSSIRKKMKNTELQALRDYLNNEGSLGEYWKHGDLENG